VDCEPLTAFAPDQAPDAVHAVAWVEDQVRVDFPPLATELGLALRVMLGAGCVTDTVVDCTALAPLPLQVNVYVVSAVSAPVEAVPLTAFAPLHPPEALHEVALLEDQVRVEPAPLATVLGLALRLTVTLGCALTVTVADCTALPPAPLQVSVYVALAVSAPVDCEPLSAFAPDQAPEAVHAVAWVADQFKVALAPLLMALGPTLRLTAGAGAATDTIADCVAVPEAPLQVNV
jgi:hypothetical protein